MTPTELRAHRRDLGYSIKVLAEVLGMDSVRLQAWECGDELIPDAEELEIAFRALRGARRKVWPSLDQLDALRV